MELQLSLEKKKIIKKSLKTAEISLFEGMFRKGVFLYVFTSLHFDIVWEKGVLLAKEKDVFDLFN